MQALISYTHTHAESITLGDRSQEGSYQLDT